MTWRERYREGVAARYTRSRCARWLSGNCHLTDCTCLQQPISLKVDLEPLDLETDTVMDEHDSHWEHAGEIVLPAWAVTFESTNMVDVYELAASWLHRVEKDAIDILCSSVGFTVDNAVTLTVCYRATAEESGPVRAAKPYQEG